MPNHAITQAADRLRNATGWLGFYRASKAAAGRVTIYRPDDSADMAREACIAMAKVGGFPLMTRMRLRARSFEVGRNALEVR